MPNFSHGPVSCWYNADAAIEGLLEKACERGGGTHGNGDPLAIPLLEVLLESDLPDAEAKAFLQGVKDDPYKDPYSSKRQVEDLRIFLTPGRAVETPATSGGRGSYNYWRKYGNLYVEYKWQDVSYSDCGEAWLSLAFAQ